MEHEGIAWGLLIGSLILRKKLGRLFLPFVAISAFGIISEPLFADFYSNPAGSLFSVNLGLALSFVMTFLFRRHRR